MKTYRSLLATAGIALTLLSPAGKADSVAASCGFAASPGDTPVTTGPCTFSQRQGYVDIYLGNEETISLSPVGDAPGNYVDAQGRASYRRSGLAQDGTIFQLPERTLFVYWLRDKLRCEAEELSRPGGCAMRYRDIDFTVSATSGSSLNRLTVVPAGLALVNQPEEADIDGSAYAAELADLDTDGWPELYVYIASAGSGSYGSLYGRAVNKGKSMSPVYLPPLAQVEAQGYQGHDEFAVVENRLVRRFPLYRDKDINAAPAGGWRQIQYRLQAGEAGWILVVDRVVEY